LITGRNGAHPVGFGLVPFVVWVRQPQREEIIVKYLLLFVDSEETNSRSEAESHALEEKIGAWWGEHAQAGEILSGERLQGPETATTVRHDHGTVTIVDGPFIEAKEHIGGYGLIDVNDLDAALELAKSWPWGGVVEVRPIFPTP
jgi:hypothetical protein